MSCEHKRREKTGGVQYVAPLRFEWRCLDCGDSWYEEDPESLAVRECCGSPGCPLCASEDGGGDG